MKKNTLIISGISAVLIILSVIIFAVLVSDNEIKYEGGTPNVAVTTFTAEMGKNLLSELYPNENTNLLTMLYTDAYESLMNGTIDVVLALKPTEEMNEYAKTTLNEVEMIPIAKDALIVMNNRYNPVKNMFSEQFRKIFSGEITNWSQVNGENHEIIPYLNTSSYDSYFALRDILAEKSLFTPKFTLKLPNLANIMKAIGEYEDTSDSAIGYALFYQSETVLENKNIDILSIDGISPSIQSIETGEYPLTVDIYAIIRKNSAENSRARRLVNFILSEEGQNIIDKNGYFKK